MPKPPTDVRIPRGSGKPPKSCSSCQSQGTVAEAFVDFPVVIQNEEFCCRVPRMICSACGAAYSTPQQFDRSIELGVASFQRTHGLLTADEIKENRKRLGWTQEELATAANVGIASVKRWERGRQVQTAANDQAIRDALSIGEDYADLVIVTVRQTRLYTIGDLKSFSHQTPANPEAKRFKKRKLRPETSNFSIADQTFPEDCYA